MAHVFSTDSRIRMAAAAMAALLVSASGKAEQASGLIIDISGLSPTSGSVMIGVYDSADAWDDGQAVGGARAEVDGGQVRAVVSDLPPGRYGIKLYHDVNGNGELDTNLMGMPTEPYAFSNNALGRFGPPSWDAAVFELSAESLVHSIRFD